MSTVIALSSAAGTGRAQERHAGLTAQAAPAPALGRTTPDGVDAGDDHFDFAAARKAAAARVALDQYQMTLAETSDGSGSGAVGLAEAEAAYREFD